MWVIVCVQVALQKTNKKKTGDLGCSPGRSLARMATGMMCTPASNYLRPAYRQCISHGRVSGINSSPQFVITALDWEVPVTLVTLIGTLAWLVDPGEVAPQPTLQATAN